ncbi:MAG: metallophosphoesterase family protein [Deltaproteobacteria bacterium]|nr:metallophosphoesterase family protein [Deltaproteobacteria bacterium]
MRLVVAVCILVAARAASAACIPFTDCSPFVNKGPVITGVTATEAWVAWYTIHHQGTGSTCSYDWSVSSGPDSYKNTNVPTLTLSPAAGSGSTFQDPSCDQFHKTHLTGLAPGTRYSFTLDMPYDATPTPATGSFTTAPTGSTGVFQFLVYGDNRNGVGVVQTDTRPLHETLAGALAGLTAVAFIAHTGDFALNLPLASGDDRGWTEFFEVERQILRGHPIFPVLGNHESISTSFYDGLLNPAAMAGSTHPYYYSIDWGQVHIAFLDSFEGSQTIIDVTPRNPGLTDEQAAWLDADLGAARAAGKLLFVVSHQGAYSYSNDTSAHGGGPDVKAKVVPLMVKHGVLALFAGHDHYYQRGREDCTDYFVIGGGGADEYEPDPTAAGVAVAQRTVSFGIVTIDGTAAHIDVYDATAPWPGGTPPFQVIDSFDLTPASCTPPTDGGVDALPPSDAGPPLDADAARHDGAPTGDGPGAVNPASGCGCRATGGTAGPGFALLALILLARTRRPLRARATRRRAGEVGSCPHEALLTRAA